MSQDLQAITSLVGDLSVIAVCILWIRAERDDNHQLWQVIESLVKLRLQQIEEDIPSETKDS